MDEKELVFSRISQEPSSIETQGTRSPQYLIKKQAKRKPRSLLSFPRRSSFARSIVRKAVSSTLVERWRRSATYCPIQESATLCIRR